MPTKKKSSIQPDYKSLAWYTAPLQSENFARLGKGKADRARPTLDSLQKEINQLKQMVAAMVRQKPLVQARPVGR